MQSQTGEKFKRSMDALVRFFGDASCEPWLNLFWVIRKEIEHEVAVVVLKAAPYMNKSSDIFSYIEGGNELRRRAERHVTYASIR